MIINAYPTGITLPDSLNSVECSAKPEVLSLAIRATLPYFKHLILICQPHFLKYCAAHGFIDGEAMSKSHLILGGAWTPYNYLDFVAAVTKTDASLLTRRTLSLYGVAEIGLGIGTMTSALEAQRRTLSPSYKERHEAVPMLFQLDSQRFLLESVNGELICTSLNPDSSMPILRYAMGDAGTLLSDGEIASLSSTTAQGGAPHFSLSGRGTKAGGASDR
jgi:phenylacetate-coenzyme A ligase PaaK-like adenylate-forming protein